MNRHGPWGYARRVLHAFVWNWAGFGLGFLILMRLVGQRVPVGMAFVGGAVFAAAMLLLIVPLDLLLLHRVFRRYNVRSYALDQERTLHSTASSDVVRRDTLNALTLALGGRAPRPRPDGGLYFRVRRSRLTWGARVDISFTATTNGTRIQVLCRPGGRLALVDYGQGIETAEWVTGIVRGTLPA